MPACGIGFHARSGRSLNRVGLRDRRRALSASHRHTPGPVEVRGLRAAGYGPELKSQQSLGYRQLSRYLSGVGTLEEAIEATKRDTRRFAKRQISWFNGDPRLQWIDGEPEPVAEAIVERVERLVGPLIAVPAAP